MDKVLKFKNYFLIILFVLLLGACKEDEEDVNYNPATPASEVYLSGFVTIDGEPVANNSFIVNDYFGEASINEGTFDMSTMEWEGLPQLLYVTDNDGNIVMLNKSFDAFKEINEESTAFALLSLNPLFGHLKAEEYQEVLFLVKNTMSYPEYFETICKSIKEGQNIFDENNTELLNNLNKVVSEFFSYKIKSRSIEGIVNDNDTEPIKVTNNGATVVLQVKGLNPSYEVSVIHNTKEYIKPTLVKSHNSYGVLDLFKPQEMPYGEELEIPLNEDGRFDFFCSSTSDIARWDLRLRLLSDFCSCIGLINDILIDGDDELSLLINIEKALYDATYDDINIIGALSEACHVYMINKGINSLEGIVEAFGKKIDSEKIKGISKNMSKFLNALGVANGIFRGSLAFIAPQEREFKICVENGTLQKCENPNIYILGGNNQVWERGKTLPKELKVGVNATFGSKVRFEVTNGGGSLDKEFANIKIDDNGNSYATNIWTLGTDGAQSVDAYIVNQDGTKASLSVRFTASFEEEGDLLMSVGDFLTFKYDSQGRPEIVAFRYDDDYEKATFTYNSESVIPSKIVSFTSDQSLSYNAVWSNFKTSKDGKRIESFQWTEDGDKGNVTIIYDIDDRIISITDRATDGNTKTTFSWDGFGRLEKSQTIENDPEDPVNFTIRYSYDNAEENPTHMYPFAMCIDMPWFFMTGLFGEGPSILPSQRKDIDAWDPESNMTLGLEYGTLPSGKISYEKISFGPIVETMPYTYGSVSRGEMNTENAVPTFPGFDKRSRKSVRRIGHSHK